MLSSITYICVYLIYQILARLTVNVKGIGRNLLMPTKSSTVSQQTVDGMQVQHSKSTDS